VGEEMADADSSERRLSAAIIVDPPDTIMTDRFA